MRHLQKTGAGGWLLIFISISVLILPWPGIAQTPGAEAVLFNALADPPLRLPETVKGHIQARLTQFDEMACPSRSMTAGDAILIHFTLRDSTLVSEATPLFVRIHRRDDDNRMVVVYQEQFEIRPGKNHLRIAPAFSAGEYELTFGFYFRDQLSEPYPRFYQKRCRITLAE